MSAAHPDEEDFLHLWKVVGHYLGVAPSIVPVDIEDARALMDAIREDQWAPSVQGRLLATELIGLMREYLPGRVLDDLPAALIRFFAPPLVPQLLGIADTGSLDFFLGAGKRLTSMFGIAVNDETRREVVRRLSRDLMVGLVGAQRNGKRNAIRIPTALARGWNLSKSA